MLASFAPEPKTGRLPQVAFEAELNDLVFGIAHQIRNPMGIIRSLAEDRLARTWVAPAEKRAMEAVLRAIENLKERLEQLVDFTQPLRLKTERVDPRVCVERALAEVEAQCRGKGVRVVQRIVEGIPAIKADASGLREALLNLLVNAIEAMPRGGTLTVSARYDEAEGAVRIEAEDTGVGVAPEHLKDVGRPFFTTKPGGVGLGFAISRRILAAHGGTLEFESRPGAGSRAVMTLPVRAERS
jgi:signal transduction histidine kinase